MSYGRSIGVQQVMQEMERLQAKGEIPQEELAALESDMTGKVRSRRCRHGF
jgi:hypothetical protein